MQMYVHDGLPRCFTDVEADVVSIRCQFLVQLGLYLEASGPDRPVLLIREFKGRGHMTLWNDESVPVGNRESVSGCHAERRIGDQPIRGKIAKLAIDLLMVPLWVAGSFTSVATLC
jgi:hypothetical protein